MERKHALISVTKQLKPNANKHPLHDIKRSEDRFTYKL